MLLDTWVADEMADPDFGDVRLNKRLVTLLAQLTAQPTQSLPQACGTWAATKAAYRFMDSAKVTPQGIRDAHHHAVLERGRRLERTLLLQDTTDLDFTHHPQTKGLGPLGATAAQGLKVHSGLLVSDTGVPLGLLTQSVWARSADDKGKSRDWRKRPIEDKESRKWLVCLDALKRELPPNRRCVVIGDREADLYPLFAAARSENTDLLVRAAYNRRIDAESHTLTAALAAAPVVGTRTLSLRSRDGRPAREAVLEVRFTTVTLVPPAYYKGKYPAVTLCVIEARETSPPLGENALHWRLLTTLAVTDFEGACQCLDWYSHRWMIEQYHRTLKSGCQIEALQLETAVRLQVALALYCLVAWRLLWLTYEARRVPNASCATVLQPQEWQALYCSIHRTPTPPQKPPSLREAVRWIAQLGGFLARKGDGEPGVQTLWRGMQRLHDLAEMWKLLHTSQTYG